MKFKDLAEAKKEIEYLGNGSSSRATNDADKAKMSTLRLSNSDLGKFKSLFEKFAKKHAGAQVDNRTDAAGNYGSARLYAAKSGKIQTVDGFSSTGHYGLTTTFTHAVQIGTAIPNVLELVKEIKSQARAEMLKQIKSKFGEHVYDGYDGISTQFGYDSGAIGHFYVGIVDGTNYITVGVGHKPNGIKWK